MAGLAAVVGEKNKGMNERVEAFFFNRQQPAPENRTVRGDGDESSDTSSEANGSIRRESSSSSGSTGKSGFMKKVRRGGKKMSMSIFK